MSSGEDECINPMCIDGIIYYPDNTYGPVEKACPDCEEN